MKKNTAINLTGKWISLRWEASNNNDQWAELFKQTYLEKDLWIFGSVYETENQSEGKLICAFGDSDVSVNTFAFLKEDATLHVGNESGKGDDERYRVVRQDDETIILYSLEGVSDESKNYRLRVVLKKITYVGD